MAKLEILVADEPVPAFARIVSRKTIERESEDTVEKLYKLLPRQMFATKIQAKALGRIISSRTLPSTQLSSSTSLPPTSSDSSTSVSTCVSVRHSERKRKRSDGYVIARVMDHRTNPATNVCDQPFLFFQRYNLGLRI